MRIFASPEFLSSVMVPLGIAGKNAEPVRADDYSVRYLERGRLCLCRGEGTDGVAVEISDEEKWLLDIWQDVFETECRPTGIRCSGGEEAFSYFPLTGAPEGSEELKADGGAAAETAERWRTSGIRCADIFLMIPARLRGAAPESRPCRLGERLSDALADVCRGEFSGDYPSELSRTVLGRVDIEIDVDGETCRLRAFSELVTHGSTGFSVIELGVPCCGVCGTALLNSWTGDAAAIISDGKRMSAAEYASSLGADACGTRRGIVFSYSPLSEETLLNALVSEYKPMGKIVGSYFKNLALDDLAQYDTADAYASQMTFVEIIRAFEPDIMKRIEYQAIEIFFIELLLMQDAGVSSVYARLLAEEKIQREGGYDVKASKKTFEDINFDMSQIQRFSDYGSFRYPTVRVSAERIAKAFGIDRVFERYERNREMLDYMLSVNIQREERRDDAFKNGLLLVLTLLSGLGPIDALVNDIAGRPIGHSYSIASAAAFGVLALYFVLRAIRKGMRIHAKKGVLRAGEHGRDA